jgi:hypothetical protein
LSVKNSSLTEKLFFFKSYGDRRFHNRRKKRELVKRILAQTSRQIIRESRRVNAEQSRGIDVLPTAQHQAANRFCASPTLSSPDCQARDGSLSNEALPFPIIFDRGSETAIRLHNNCSVSERSFL